MFFAYRSTQEKILGDSAGHFRGTSTLPQNLEHTSGLPQSRLQHFMPGLPISLDLIQSHGDV